MTFIVADVVEGIYMDSKGKGHHGPRKTKSHRSQSGVPGEAGEEINSGRIRRDARLRNRSKEHGLGTSGRVEVRTECGQCSAEDDVLL